HERMMPQPAGLPPLATGTAKRHSLPLVGCSRCLLGPPRMRIGYRRRSSTRMVAPKAFSASSKNAKWWAHQSSEPPCIITVSTAARAEQRSHTSAAVRDRAGFLSSEAFISATPPRPSGDFFDIKCGSTHRDKNPTSDCPRADLKRLLRQHHYRACRELNKDFEQTHLRRRIAHRCASVRCQRLWPFIRWQQLSQQCGLI